VRLYVDARYDESSRAPSRKPTCDCIWNYDAVRIRQQAMRPLRISPATGFCILPKLRYEPVDKRSIRAGVRARIVDRH